MNDRDRDHLIDSIHAGMCVNDIECVAIADAILADGWRKPRVIETIEDLTALPDGSVILDRDGDLLERDGDDWDQLRGYGWVATSNVDLPARVLWTPEADQ